MRFNFKKIFFVEKIFNVRKITKKSHEMLAPWDYRSGIFKFSFIRAIFTAIKRRN
jgi:hypothetical protein